MKILIATLVAGLILIGCSTYRPPDDEVALMPTQVARTVIDKHFGVEWGQRPSVSGSGLSKACSSEVRQVAYSDFVSALYIKGIGLNTAKYTVGIEEGRWTFCNYNARVQGLSLKEAQQLTAAINALGGRIKMFYN